MGYRLPEELRQLDFHLSSTFRDRFAWEQRHTSSIDSFMPARKQKDGECRRTSEAPSPLQFLCCTGKLAGVAKGAQSAPISINVAFRLM